MKKSETHGGTVLCASQDRQEQEEGISAWLRLEAWDKVTTTTERWTPEKDGRRKQWGWKNNKRKVCCAGRAKPQEVQSAKVCVKWVGAGDKQCCVWGSGRISRAMRYNVCWVLKDDKWDRLKSASHARKSTTKWPWPCCLGLCRPKSGQRWWGAELSAWQSVGREMDKFLNVFRGQRW